MDELRAASTSVGATGAVMALYVAVWLLTGSLAALAELAHTLVDAVAVATTFLAVRASLKPPDAEHPYGHQKADTLGGFIGSIVVLIAASLIAYEAVERVISWTAFNPDPFAAGAVAAAVLIDVNRVRMLRKFRRSRALSADALHFTTDIFASLGVLMNFVAGLYLIESSPALFKAAGPLMDVVAAAAITAVFTTLSFKLLRASAIELLDYAPPEVVEDVRRLAGEVPGVAAVKDVKVRKAGRVYHGELTIRVPGGISIEEAHEIADAVEERVKAELGGVVVVHVEPAPGEKSEGN